MTGYNRVLGQKSVSVPFFPPKVPQGTEPGPRQNLRRNMLDVNSEIKPEFSGPSGKAWPQAVALIAITINRPSRGE